MKFALLYHYDPTAAGPSAGEVADWTAFDKDVRDAGALVHEAGFQDQDRARTVAIRDGAPAVSPGGATTGPDVLAGLYVVDVEDIDAAVRLAERIPTAGYGKVEVRPVVEL